MSRYPNFRFRWMTGLNFVNCSNLKYNLYKAKVGNIRKDHTTIIKQTECEIRREVCLSMTKQTKNVIRIDS